MGRSSRGFIGSQLTKPSVAQFQAADPRLTWTEDMRRQAPSAKGGASLPPPNFSGQQIGEALKQQALQQQALADKAYEQQQSQQQGGFGRLT